MDYNEDWRGLCWQQGMFHLDLIFSVCQSTHSWASSEIWSRHCTGALRVVAGIHVGREESDTTERLHFHFFFSCIGEGNGNPFQCSCLENPRDRGAGWAAVYGVTQSRTRLKRLSSSTHLSLSLHLCNTSVPATVLIQGWYRDTGIIKTRVPSLGEPRVQRRRWTNRLLFYSSRCHDKRKHEVLWENTHCCWVVKSYPTLWPHGVQHAVLTCPSLFPEFAQTHVHWVGDAIQPSHLRSPPSPPALNLSKNQFLFQWTSSWHQVAKVLTTSASVLLMNILGWFPLALTGLISLLSKGLSRVFSSTTVWKHQFFGTHPCLWSNSHIHTWLPEKP